MARSERPRQQQQNKLDPESQTLWLSRVQIGQLYGKAKSTISEHLTHIFEGELDSQVVVRENRTTTRHGAIEDKTQDNITRFYNLDAIIAVGLRVRSKQGTLFRRWAIERLKNYHSTCSRGIIDPFNLFQGKTVVSVLKSKSVRNNVKNSVKLRLSK